MSADDNKTLVERVMTELWNAKNYSKVDELFAPELVAHNLPTNIPPNRDGLKMVVTAMCNALPDAKFIIRESIAEGDKITSQ